MDIIFKIGFNIIWGLFWSLFLLFCIYIYNRKKSIQNNIWSLFFSWVVFIFSSLSILGGIKMCYIQWLKDYQNDFKIDNIYIYLGIITAICVFCISIQKQFK